MNANYIVEEIKTELDEKKFVVILYGDDGKQDPCYKYRCGNSQGYSPQSYYNFNMVRAYKSKKNAQKIADKKNAWEEKKWEMGSPERCEECTHLKSECICL